MTPDDTLQTGLDAETARTILLEVCARHGIDPFGQVRPDQVLDLATELRQRYREVGATDDDIALFAATVIDFAMRDPGLTDDGRKAVAAAVCLGFQVHITMKAVDDYRARYVITHETIQ